LKGERENNLFLVHKRESSITNEKGGEKGTSVSSSRERSPTLILGRISLTTRREEEDPSGDHLI